MASRTLYALALLAASLVTVEGCTCYLTNHTTINGLTGTSRYQNYAFYDFSKASVLQSPRGLPPLVKNTDGDPNKTTNYFFESGDFGNAWNLAAGQVNNPYNDNGKDKLFNTAQNAYIRKDNSTNSTMMTLRASRLFNEDSQDPVLSGAGLVGKEEILYASFRMRARVNGTVGGAVAGLYLHRDNANGSAIEIKTSSFSTTASASLQMVPLNHTVTDLPNGAKWEDWHTYRLDWTPDAVSAWIDNTTVAVRDASTAAIPSDPTNLQLAFGSDTGDWTGIMNSGGWSTMDVQWIEVAYNTSTPAGSANCGDDGALFCSVDQENQPGEPIGGAEPSAASGIRVGCAWMVAGVMAIMMLL